MKAKCVFVDIDNTLNVSSGKVTAYTKDVMKRLKEKGIIVVVNTGRSAKYAIEKSKEASLSNYIVSSNGAEVYDYVNDVIIFEQSIPAETVKNVYKYCQRMNLTLILNTLVARFINKKEYKYNNEPVEYFSDIDEILNKYPINQLVILSENYDRMLVIPHMFKEKFPNLKVVHSSMSLIEEKRIKNKEYYHDLVLENTAKSTGLVELLDYLKINADDVIAAGDGYDDVCMFDVVGTSIAVGNANEKLKEIATYIADTVQNDGVAKMLEKLLLEN